MNNFNEVKLGFFLDDKYDNESQLCLFVEDVDGESDPIFLNVLTDMVNRIEETVLQHFNEKQDWDLAIKDIESVVLKTIRRELFPSEKFHEEIYEIAFGEGAIDKDYSEDEVIERLRDWSNEGVYMHETLTRIEKEIDGCWQNKSSWEAYD